MTTNDLSLLRSRLKSNGVDGNGRRHGRLKFDDLKKATYVSLIRQGVRRVHASELVGVSYPTVLEHLDRFPAFADEVSQAEMARIDEVEEALYETALNGNVIAQQVVLFNRRADEWADQRLLRSRLEAAAAGAEAEETRAGETALESLRGKLAELRERLVPEDPVEATTPDPVEVGLDGDTAA